jgi:hypothetical protein
MDDVPLLQIFLHICSYLDARFITHSLSLVCKRFHDMLSDAVIWRLRIAKRWGSKYPPIPGMLKVYSRSLTVATFVSVGSKKLLFSVFEKEIIKIIAHFIFF